MGARKRTFVLPRDFDARGFIVLNASDRPRPMVTGADHTRRNGVRRLRWERSPQRSNVSEVRSESSNPLLDPVACSVGESKVNSRQRYCVAKQQAG